MVARACLELLQVLLLVFAAAVALAAALPEGCGLKKRAVESDKNGQQNE